MSPTSDTRFDPGSAAQGRTGRPLVLVIEDDEDIGRALETLLCRNGYQVRCAGAGRQGLRLFHESRPDLVILDVGLPELDGWTLLERMRDLSSAPVLVLTARSAETDKVRGLRSGADDYLTKPFGNQELLARLEVLLRRRQSSDDTPPSLSAGEVSVDLAARHVEVAGQPVELTPTEYRLLETFLRHPGQVLSPEQLLRSAWQDPTATGPDRVKFTVLRLRRKLGGSPEAEDLIETVRGFGYRLRKT